jgi:hypothetical protein
LAIGGGVVVFFIAIANPTGCPSTARTLSRSSSSGKSSTSSTTFKYNFVRSVVSQSSSCNLRIGIGARASVGCKGKSSGDEGREVPEGSGGVGSSGDSAAG